MGDAVAGHASAATLLPHSQQQVPKQVSTFPHSPSVSLSVSRSPFPSLDDQQRDDRYSGKHFREDEDEDDENNDHYSEHLVVKKGPASVQVCLCVSQGLVDAAAAAATTISRSTAQASVEAYL